MHYSNTPDSVRVDFFKSSGKWYTTEAVMWIPGGYDIPDIHEAFALSLREHFKEKPDRLCEMDAVCLEPYHEHAHPIQMKRGEWRTYQGWSKPRPGVGTQPFKEPFEPVKYDSTKFQKCPTCQGAHLKGTMCPICFGR